MARATWNGAILADSEDYEIVEGNVYFPPGSVRRQFLKDSETHTTCPWKGVASYYHVEVGDQVNRDAAWYYPQTREAARNIEGYVAFWRGVEVTH